MGSLGATVSGDLIEDGDIIKVKRQSNSDCLIVEEIEEISLNDEGQIDDELDDERSIPTQTQDRLQEESSVTLSQTSLQREANRICAKLRLPYMVIRPSLANGSCFFSSICISASSDEISRTLSDDAREAVQDHLSLRLKVIDMLEHNAEIHTQSILEQDKIAALNLTGDESEEEKERRWKNYLQNMKSQNTWADELIIRATALYMKKDTNLLFVVQSDNLAHSATATAALPKF